MSNPFIKDTKPAIIHIDGRLIRAGKGIADLLEKPSITIQACYGLRSPSSNAMEIDQPTASSSSQERPLSEYIMGQALEDAMKGDDKVNVFWPWEPVGEEWEGKKGKSKKEVDWRGREALLHHILTNHLEVHIPTSNTTLLLIPPSAPLPPSHLAAYSQISFERLNTPAFCILDLPVAAIFGVSTTTPTGLVVHIGRRTTEIACVVESCVRTETRVSVDVGMADCEEFFTELLLEDKEARAAVEKLAKEVFGEESWEAEVKDVAKKVAEEVIRDGSFSVPGEGGVIGVMEEEQENKEEEGVFNVAQMLIQGDAAKQVAQLKSKKSAKDQTAAALKAQSMLADARAEKLAQIAADVHTYTILSLPKGEGKGKRQISLGIIRNRAAEPLYEGKGEGTRTVQEGMGRCVELLERGWRQAVWEGVVFVGEMARVGSLPVAMISYLTPYLITSPSDEAGERERDAGDRQADHVRMLKIPGYFPNFKDEHTDLAPFLGASMAAKLIFSDNRNRQCITKADYSQHGPAAIYLAGVLD